MSALADISITCFAASYSVAWLLEVSRLFFRSGVRGAVMIAFAVAGLVAQTLYLGYRAASVESSPLSSSFDWCLLVAWLLVVVYLYFTWYHPRAMLGLFLLPLVLFIVGVAGVFADRQPIAPVPASQTWGAIHGIFLLLGTVTVSIGFVAGLMYLVAADRLKRKLPPPAGLRFPSLEWLEKVNSRVVIVSVVLVGIGFLAGVVLNLSAGRRAAEISWNDPVISSSALMLVWLIAAALFNGVYRPARYGRKVAYLTVASFGFLAISLGALLLVHNEHGGQKGQAPATLDPRSTGGDP